ncbi:MAG: hypothetical protein CMB97_02110 [Flavobacteriaceae bacterium]|uniref:restriction endonuclease n=1 Tax=Winogradskyella sp. SYSU M77433 TaxID=3042722 RepID=UPI000C98602E|nr:restriction endonuclease [Winogradskyella sp. SYSU M77433]MAG86187.1 hypothetical protein [Flavobacteriaceae bacterium]MDH7912013.1 restriction endonuclease [Winogradskyella sp. SYSU M77433]
MKIEDTEEIHKLKEIVEELCEKYRLTIEIAEDNYFKIFTDQSSGITLFLQLDENQNLSFYFLQRTYDVFYTGDRSDAHVILSLMFTSFLRFYKTGISCEQFDIAHPVVPDEIWGRYLVPVQVPILHGISTAKQLIEVITEIIEMVAFWRESLWYFSGCPCDKCLKAENIDNSNYKYSLEDVEALFSDLHSISSRNNYGDRERPEWVYFYDIEVEVTMIKSSSLAKFLSATLDLCADKTEQLKGQNGTFVLSDNIKNFVHDDTRFELDEYFNIINKDGKLKGYPVIPMENMVVTVMEDYIIALGRICGFEEYKKEKELIRQRHNRESELLFPISQFKWKEKVCPEQFELLVKALLEREPSVKSVRRPAPVNQGDKGRDLIIEWNVINEYMSDITPPKKLIKVVGQCKSGKSTIGKGKVMDIRDTVETHDSQGFFLAVNTQISAPLTEKLESLQSKGIWTFWWNRDDIEMRLSKNQDLIPMFPNVLTSKDHIKFVDRED